MLNVIVTGGSKGIGKKISEKLSVNYNVFNLSRTKINLKKIKNVYCDVQNLQSIKDAFKKINKIDCLINNAGISYYNKDKFINFSNIIDVNLKGVYYCCELALTKLKRSKTSKIINISSINAYLAFPGNPGYVSSKGAVNSLTRALALDYSKFGISVNSISPGYINEGMAKKSFENKKLRQQRLDRMIIKRFGTAQDIYSVIKFLMDKDTKYITGEDIKVDGGWTARGL
jgi:NAD(P)-dependent dehydrogenase (short-subunit alcohol dehydrogenase family)